jgi:hypothetical protein
MSQTAQRQLRRWSSAPHRGGSVAGCDALELLPGEAERRQLEGSPAQQLHLPDLHLWDVYQKLVGPVYDQYLQTLYEDVTLAPWTACDGRLVRRLTYTARTEVRWGPSLSRMVELQELQHRPGGSFVRWSSVRALDVMLGDRFYVHMRVEGRPAAAGGVRVEQQVGLVFRRTALGLGGVIQKETQGRCRRSLERWRDWALHPHAKRPASSASQTSLVKGTIIIQH